MERLLRAIFAALLGKSLLWCEHVCDLLLYPEEGRRKPFREVEIARMYSFWFFKVHL